MKSERNFRFTEVVLEVILLTICWGITDYLMANVWHSESAVIEFFTLAVSYVILYIPMELLLRKHREKKEKRKDRK